MNKSLNTIFFIGIYAFLACSEAENPQTDTFKYLALGDSYTIGESVDEADRWPVQLSDSLKSVGFEIKETRIIAKTGWTTNELMDSLSIAKPETDYNLVSLLIGVNNQYRGYELNQYREEFEELLDQSINYASGDTSRVFVVSIPDYGVTPFARNRNPEKIGSELDIYNAVADSICRVNNIPFIEITEASRLALSDSKLIASDSLHPSGLMYRNWVDAAYNTAEAILQKQMN